MCDVSLSRHCSKHFRFSLTVIEQVYAKEMDLNRANNGMGLKNITIASVASLHFSYNLMFSE